MPKINLGKKLGKTNKFPKKPDSPLWLGPEDDSDMGGITQSMLGGFLSCRERFRLKVVEGLRPPEAFSHRLEYGQMWHICEEHLAAEVDWEQPLLEYCRKLMMKYRTQRKEIEQWYQVCRTQFPIYINYWEEHEDVLNRVPYFQEEVFKVPYQLKSGAVVYLRGKFDSVDIIGDEGLFLQENKTKGDVFIPKIKAQLRFDLQSMMYLVALREHLDQLGEDSDIGGIRYNVVRRPLSGGKGSIRKHKGSKNKPPETYKAFYARLGGIIEEEPELFFSRFKVGITPEDLEQFEETCLQPLLEQLVYWYDWVTKGDPFRYGNTVHWRHPYGLYNVIDEGGTHDLDNYLESGEMLGLTYVDTLFNELKED